MECVQALKEPSSFYLFSSYLDLNTSCLSGCRRYSLDIPEYLHDRPRLFVTHCMKKLDSAEDTPASCIQSCTSRVGMFYVKSQSTKDVIHQIFMGDQENLPWCTCQDFQRTRWPCKHFFSVFKHVTNCGFTKLPEHYLANPLITLDSRKPPCKDDSNPESQEQNNAETLKDQNTEAASSTVSSEFATIHSVPEISDEEAPNDINIENQDPNIAPKKNEKADKSALLAEQTACRERLQLIRDHTYLVNDPKVLSRVRGSLDDIIQELQGATKTEKGIPLETTTKPQQKLSMRAEYLPLKKRKGKKKFLGRSGSKASLMRKTFLVDVPVPSSRPKDSKQRGNVFKQTMNACDHGCGNHNVPIKEDTPRTEKFTGSENANEAPFAEKPSVKTSSASVTAHKRRLPEKESIISDPVGEPHPKRSCPNQAADDLSLPADQATQSNTPVPPKEPTQPGVQSKSKQSTQPVQSVKVVRGTLNRQHLAFREVNRGERCTSNSLTFLLHHITVPEEKISTSMIDAILRVGDRVHTALTNALGNPGQRLSLEEVQTAIQMTEESQTITFPQDILTGDVFSNISDFPFVTLERSLQTALQANTGALLRFLEYTVAIKKLSDGTFTLFDPHARNLNGFVDGDGTAIALLFPTLEALTGYVRRFIRHRWCEKGVPVLEDCMPLAAHTFEALAISTGDEIGSSLLNLIKGTKEARNDTR